MTGEPIIVRQFTDLEHARLTHAGIDLVLNTLAAADDGGYGIVVWTEDWIAREKSLEPLEGTRTLFGIHDILTTSEKAWCVTQDPHTNDDPSDGVWLPKSCSEIYKADPLGVDPSTNLQSGLEEFGRQGQEEFAP